MSPRVSIIIPAYNAEGRISCMLDSVLAQTFSDYEVIVINDGSTDETIQVLEKYAAKDERIRILNQENRGVSEARNRGLDEANGDYILFYDADDFIPKNAMTDLYHTAREKLADLVIGFHEVVYGMDVHVPRSARSLAQKETIQKNDKDLCWNFTLCNKMFKRSVIQENHLRFNGTTHGEDGLFLFQFIRNADTIAGCPHQVYSYRKRPFWESTSLSQQASTDAFLDAKNNTLEILRLLEEEESEDMAAIRSSEETTPTEIERQWQWNRMKAVLWKRLASTTLLSEYYRRLWNGDDRLYSALRDTLEECRKNMFPSQWESLLEENEDLQLEAGLLSPEALVESPLLSVILTAKLPKNCVAKMLKAYYEQQYVSFEVLIDEKLWDMVPENYREKPNLRSLPHNDLSHWKKKALQEARGVNCVILEEPIYPEARTIRQMVNILEDSDAYFATAPLSAVKNGKISFLKTQNTVFINELSVIHPFTKYNQLDGLWGNKIFNIKALLAKKRLFEKDSTKDIHRLYRNTRHVKCADCSFFTELTEEDVRKRVASLWVKTTYKWKRRREDRRVQRLERESTEKLTWGQIFRRWRNRKIRGGYKFITLKIIFPLYYRWNARKPIEKNKVLFIVNRRPVLPNAMTYVHELLEKSGKFTIHDKFLLNLSRRIRQQFKVDMELMKDLATANYVFLDEATVTTCGVHKRPETKIVQLWHGCGAFKKFGFSTADKIFGGNAKEQKRYPMYRNFDLVCVSSPEVVWAYEEAMQLKGVGNIKPVGVSRTDVFFQEDYIAAAVKRVEDAIPAARDKKIILYAPTFRGTVAKAYGPDQFDYHKLYEALGEEYIILVKHHPLVKKLPEIPLEYRDSFVYDVSRSMEIEDLICASDICISDYSSLIFEYSLFEKPIILFAYDLDVYFDWRGFYYDYFEMAPGPVLISTEEIIDYIVHIDTRFDRKKMHAFREKFMRSCDGHSTERILEEVGIEL